MPPIRIGSTGLYGATFGQAFVRLLLGFVGFGGRASPSEFWWGFLVLLTLRILPYLLLLLIFLIGTSLDSYDPVGPTLHIGSSVVALYAILLMIAVDYGLLLPQLSMTWRRLHDANLPGPPALPMLVPLFGRLAVLVMVLPPRTRPDVDSTPATGCTMRHPHRQRSPPQPRDSVHE